MFTSTNLTRLASHRTAITRFTPSSSKGQRTQKRKKKRARGCRRCPHLLVHVSFSRRSTRPWQCGPTPQLQPGGGNQRGERPRPGGPPPPPHGSYHKSDPEPRRAQEFPEASAASPNTEGPRRSCEGWRLATRERAQRRGFGGDGRGGDVTVALLGRQRHRSPRRPQPARLPRKAPRSSPALGLFPPGGLGLGVIRA